MLDGIEDGSEPRPLEQISEGATYAPRFRSRDAEIDWTQDALQIERQIRAFDDRGGAFATAGTLRMKIYGATPVKGQYPAGQFSQIDDKLVVGCGNGGLALRHVQLNRGRGKILPFRDAANGFRTVFSSGFQFDVTL